jgi:hypothetical protein
MIQGRAKGRMMLCVSFSSGKEEASKRQEGYYVCTIILSNVHTFLTYLRQSNTIVCIKY